MGLGCSHVPLRGHDMLIVVDGLVMFAAYSMRPILVVVVVTKGEMGSSHHMCRVRQLSGFLMSV